MWRGVRGAPAAAVAAQYTAGRGVVWRGFSSASLVGDVARHFARDGGVVLRLTLSAHGTRAADVNLFSAFSDPAVSLERDEKEILLPPDLRMLVSQEARAHGGDVPVVHLVEQSAHGDTIRY